MRRRKSRNRIPLPMTPGTPRTTRSMNPPVLRTPTITGPLSRAPMISAPSTAEAVTVPIRPPSEGGGTGTVPTALSAGAAPAARGAPEKSPVVAARGHRWRYSEPDTTLGDGPAWVSAPAPVVLAGEVFGGARIEGAFTSGEMAAAALAGRMLP